MINPTPLISVVIPTYNRSALVSRAIDSVLGQTFTDFEIIVVNDGGTDATSDILAAQFADKIIYLQNQHNAGLSAARNTGIKASRGEYMAFLDDDDEWLPDKLLCQLKLMQSAPSIGLCYCGYFKMDQNGSITGEVKSEKTSPPADKLLRGNYITGSASAVLIRRSILEEAGYFDEMLSACEDWDLWIRISRICNIDFIDETLVKLCVHTTNMHKNISLMEKNIFLVLDKHCLTMEKIQKNNIYSNHCIDLAWQYYHAGNREDFSRMIIKSFSYSPLNKIYVHGEQTGEKERALFEAYDAYWCSPGKYQLTAIKRKAYAQQYLQLAWEYYHHNDMKNFRRCIKRIFAHSFSWSTIRLVVPFLKSYFGKHLADRVHAARKKLNNFLY